MSELNMQRVVIVHQDSIDPCILVQNAGITSPVEIYSFTDTHPRKNILNTKLGEITTRADHLLIDEKSFESMSDDSELAQKKLKIMYHPHTVRVFRDLVVTRIKSAPGYDLKQLEYTTEKMRMEVNG